MYTYDRQSQRWLNTGNPKPHMANVTPQGRLTSFLNRYATAHTVRDVNGHLCVAYTTTAKQGHFFETVAN